MLNQQIFVVYIIYKERKIFIKNEQKSRDAAAKKKEK